MLRTRSPVYSPLRAFSLDLHVLGTPPAFVLSQDQTLQLFSSERSSAGFADVTTTSLKALRCPQSSSWTCYPVFKDRALLHCRFARPTAVPASRRGAPATAVRGFRPKATCIRPGTAPLLQGALRVTKPPKGVKRPTPLGCNCLMGLRIPGFGEAGGRPGRPPCFASRCWPRDAPRAPPGTPPCRCAKRPRSRLP